MSSSTFKQAQLKRIRQASDGNRPATAATLAEAFLRVHPDHAPTWINLGIELIGMARYAEGRKALRRAITCCPPDKLVVVHIQMGHMYRQRGLYSQAARWYRAASAAAPDDADSYIFLGAVLARSGKLKAAEAQHRRGTRCANGCIDEAYLNLGFVLRAQQRYQEAARAFRSALEIDPKYIEASQALVDVEQLSRRPR